MRVLVTGSNLVPHRERFEAALPGGTDVVWRVGQDLGVWREDLRDADVFVGGRFTAEMAVAAEKLRLVHVVGAGTDRVDFAALADSVLVANTFHHERSIAEYILSATIMLRRGFLAQDRALRRGVWATAVYDDAIDQPPTLRDARVGFGHIGQRAWAALRALGCVEFIVTGSGRVDAGTHGLEWAEGMIGSGELRALGPDGVLVNVGRGPLVDERALYDALREGVIRAAAIDVWYRYPTPGGGQSAPSELPFGELANVLMTPHSSGVTTDTFTGRADDVAANVGRLTRGEALRNLVTR